ncbi:hypothetical protein D3C77_561680 [compost metagenome]
MAQVTGGDFFHHGQGFAQWASDLAGDDYRREDAYQQGQQRGGDLQGASLSAFAVAAFELDLVQRIAGLDDGGALHSHLFAGHSDSCGGITELAHGVAIRQHSAFKLLDACRFAWHLTVQAGNFSQCTIQLAQGQLLGLAADVGNVAAYS